MFGCSLKDVKLVSDCSAYRAAAYGTATAIGTQDGSAGDLGGKGKY